MGRERFLGQLNALVPWEALLAAVRARCAENGGKPPPDLERMFRALIVQHCFGVSDEGIENALDDSLSIRRFVGIAPDEAAPDRAALRKLRRLLETRALAASIFQAVNARLKEEQLSLREGVCIEARFVGDADSEWDAGENRWRFGSKPLSTDADGNAPDAPKSPPVHFDRPRVDALFAEAMRASVVSVCAGAGYGKTHATQFFLQKYRATTTWVQLSEGDNLGTRFWEGFTHAVSLSDMPLAKSLREISFPETDADYEKYLRLPERGDSARQKRVIVYDDFHLIHDKAVLRFIDRGVRSPLPNVTTVIISRVEPGLDLLGLKSIARVASVTEDELRFTESETLSYLHAQGITVTADALHDIQEETQGWFLAVNLVARLLQRNPSREFHLRASLKSSVSKLLESEISFAISERLQRLLICLSLIDHASAEIVRRLARDPSLLEELTQTTAYVRYDVYRDVYQIHHLFHDYLFQRQGVLTEEEKRETYFEAARWCEENEYWHDAIAYREKAGDHEAVVRIGHLMSMEIPEKTALRLLKALDNIPPEIAARIQRFPAVYTRLLAILRRLDEADAFARACVKKHEALPASPFNDLVLADAHTLLGLLGFLRTPETDDYSFDAHFEKADLYYARHPHKTIPRNQLIGMHAMRVGSDRPGAPEELIAALARAAHLHARASGVNMAGVDDLARVELSFYRGDLGAVGQILPRLLQTAWKSKQYDIYSLAHSYVVRLAFTQGDIAGVEQAMQSIERLAEIPDYPNRHLITDVLMALCQLNLGFSQHIVDWLKVDFEQGTMPRFVELRAIRVRMEYYFLCGRYDELLALAAELRESRRFLLARLDMKVLEALCRYRMKDRAGALAALRDAYEMSCSNRLVMPFIETGKHMRTLTLAAMREPASGIPREWLELINRRAGTHAKRQQTIIAAYKKAHGLQDGIPLSRRESEVLADLYGGLSRSEIALARNLSINTVKLVVNNLYAKLNASSVTDVVRIAAEKRLVR